jgi:signal peptidase I
LSSATKPKRKRSGVASLIELAIIIVVALLLALGIQAFLVKPYRIPSPSMEPTLDIGQRVLVNRLSGRFGTPEVGSIVVFNPPQGAESNQCGAPHPPREACPRPTPEKSDQNFIKRVVAGPGDTLAIRDGVVYRNGKREDDSGYRTLPCGGGPTCNYPEPIKIPPKHYFMMGDNRGQSDDSRFWGPVPEDWVIGDAFATYWPPDRIGFF